MKVRNLGTFEALIMKFVNRNAIPLSVELHMVIKWMFPVALCNSLRLVSERKNESFQDY